MRWFWINHPALHDRVGPVRWLKFHASEWLGNIAHRWHLDAIRPNWRDDDIPF